MKYKGLTGLLIFGLMLTFSSSQSSPSDPEKTQVRSKVAGMFSTVDDSLNYLNSYRDPVLHYNNDGCTYSSKKKSSDYCYAENLSLSDTGTEYFTFQTEYVPIVGIVNTDISAWDENGLKIDEATLFGNVISDNDGTFDIHFEIEGLSFSGNEIINRNGVETDSTISNRFSQCLNGDGGGVVSSLCISYAVVTLSQAEDLGHILCPVHSFDEGPIPYCAFLIKSKLISDDFQHNSSLTQPAEGTFINNQMDPSWKAWAFGMSNMKDAGCEIFALYNFLVSNGKKPYLPALIALVQLSNADLLLGKWGSNTIPPELLNQTYTELKVFLGSIASIVDGAIDAVAAATFGLSAAAQPIFIGNFIIPLDPLFVLTTIALLKVTLATKVITADALATYYLQNLHSIQDLIPLFNIHAVTSSTMTYQMFLSQVASRTNYLFVSYWNAVVNGRPDVSKEMHTVFVRHYPELNTFSIFNNNYQITSPSSPSSPSTQVYVFESCKTLSGLFPEGVSPDASFLTGFGVIQ